MKSRVIFASLVLGLGLVITQANAATTTNTDDSPAANKPASAMLVNGSAKAVRCLYRTKRCQVCADYQLAKLYECCLVVQPKPISCAEHQPRRPC